MNLKKIGNVFTSKFVGTGPSSCKKKNYRATVSQRLINTDLGEQPQRVKRQVATCKPMPQLGKRVSKGINNDIAIFIHNKMI